MSKSFKFVIELIFVFVLTLLVTVGLSYLFFGMVNEHGIVIAIMITMCYLISKIS